ncbi:hypothetical protein [Tenacibaculum caenipelagi]|nr:hypothetical protein [Tenacibaculum caenipelagi]
MKNLNLNQMEEISGSGHCSAAKYLLKEITAGQMALSGLYVYEAAMCKWYGDSDTFNPA